MTDGGRVLRRGAVAGLLGAAVIGAWFLLVDWSRGRPLETPALLAAVLLHGETAAQVPAATWRLVLEYSLFHVAAFELFGVAAALLLAAAEQEPPLLIALVLFFVAFEGFFVALILFHGASLERHISWWSVLAGNLLATVAMLGYFFAEHPALGRSLFGPWTRVVREGVLAGLIGALVVAIWFVGWDLARAEPFRTPAMLGNALLHGPAAGVTGTVTAVAVIAYTVFHGAAFVVFGIVAAVMLAFVERQPLLLLGVFVLFISFEVAFFAATILLDEVLVRSLGLWAILGGNLLAATAMLAYFLSRHPGLGARFTEHWTAD
jgi:hypothetical protein